MTKFSCFISGDDYTLLRKDSPESRKKVNTLAGAIFLPVTLWVFTMFLLLYVVLSESLLISVFGGLAGGLVVFSLDRIIIRTPRSKVIMISRIFIGFLIASLGAIFLDEVLFHKDIQKQLVIIEQEERHHAALALRQAKQADLSTLQQEKEARYRAWQDAIAAANREADGSGGSGQRGVHAITRQKLNTAEAYKQDYLEAASSLQALEEDLDSRSSIAEAEISDSFKDPGLLLKIEAMYDLVFSHWGMASAYIIISLILFFIEFSVVLLKLTWPETSYEKRVRLIEETARRRMECLMNHDADQFDPGRHSEVYRQTRSELNTSPPRHIFN